MSFSLLERLKKEFGSEVGSAGGSSGYSYDYDPVTQTYIQISGPSMKKGGAVKSSASKRADGCVVKGKTRGKMI